MSKKKKGQAKADEIIENAESTNEIEAVPAKAAPQKPAAQVAAKAAEKKDEVIPTVAIALLETYPSLPDKDLILLAFAEHYQGAQVRAASAAEEAKKAASGSGEAPKSRRTRYVTNPQVPSLAPSAPRTPPPTPTYQAPVYTPPVYTPPVFEAPTDAGIEAEPESVYVPPEPESSYTMDDDGTPSPQTAFGLDADDAEIFGSTAPSDDDIFSSLDKKSGASDDELGFTPSSDYSDPFIRTAGSSEPSDPFAAMPSFDQVQSTPIEEAAPSDRTMMIPAYNPPEDEAEAAPEPEAEAEAESNPTTGRKGRRGSKKKK